MGWVFWFPPHPPTHPTPLSARSVRKLVLAMPELSMSYHCSLNAWLAKYSAYALATERGAAIVRPTLVPLLLLGVSLSISYLSGTVWSWAWPKSLAALRADAPSWPSDVLGNIKSIFALSETRGKRLCLLSRQSLHHLHDSERCHSDQALTMIC